MNADGKTNPIIFPLRAKLSRMFLQQRPKVTGGRRVVLLPVLPWVDGDRPPNIQYGRVQGSPVLNMNCWVGFGLSATGAKSIRLQDLKQAQLRPTFGGKLTPDVVHYLKPMPAPYCSISGVTKYSAGAVLGSCSVELVRTDNDFSVSRLTSAADGTFTFRNATPSKTHYIVAYKSGSPDVAGTTVNTLTGA